MIKAIFIDIDSTLLDFEACVEETMKNGLAERGESYSSEMLDTFHRVNNGLWKQIEEGTLSFEELLKIRWNKIFAELGITLDGVEFETYFRKNLNESAIPVFGAEEMLSYLSKKYRLFAASNGPHEQQVGRLEKAGMLKYFEDVFTSELIGAEKPSTEFFSYCFNKIGDINPAETAMLGDSLTSDMQGGINFSMQTLWFNIKSKPSPEDMKLDYIVETLAEVQNIL